MKMLRITWVRVLASLVAGSAIQEFIHISTGDPNRPHTNNFILFYAIIMYVVFTLMVKHAGDKMR